MTEPAKGAMAARPEVRAFQAYSVAPPDLTSIRAKLDFNESPFDVPDEIKEIVCDRLMKRRWALYPEFGAARLIDAISAESGRPREEIVVGNGSGELVSAAISVFAGQGGTLLLPTPAFSLYRQLAVLAGSRLVESPCLAPKFELDEAAFLEAARSPGVVPLICSPCNPTGTTISLKVLRRLSAIAPVVLLDQAYVDFAETADDALPLLEELGNLVIFRTLSKAFAAAGFRIGYALASPPLAAELRKGVLPFNVGAAAEELAVALFEKPEFSRRAVSVVREERERVRSGLIALGAEVVLSRANFLFFRIPGRDGRSVAEWLARHQILVRDLSASTGGFLRVSIGRPEENDIFLSELKELR